jgi:hypothetical protein
VKVRSFRTSSVIVFAGDTLNTCWRIAQILGDHGEVGIGHFGARAPRETLANIRAAISLHIRAVRADFSNRWPSRPLRDLELDRRLGYSRARSRQPSAEDVTFDAAVASVRADAAAIRSEAALIFGRAK